MPEFWSEELRCVEYLPAVSGEPAFEAAWTQFDRGELYDEDYLPSYTPGNSKTHSCLDVAVDSTGRCHVVAKSYPLLGGTYHVPAFAWVDNGSGGWGTAQIILGIVSGSPAQTGYGWGGRGLWRSHPEPLAIAAPPDDDTVALFVSSNHDMAYGGSEKRRLAAPPGATAGVWSKWYHNALTEIGGTGQDILPLAAVASADYHYVAGYSTASSPSSGKPAIGYRSGGSVTIAEHPTSDYSVAGDARSADACINGDGLCHVVFEAVDTAEYGSHVIYARPSSATAWTFSTLKSDAWAPAIARDPESGNLVIVYGDYTTPVLKAIRSDDDGATWSSPVSIFADVTTRPSLACLDNGTILCVFGAWGGPDALGTALRYVISTDGGATWTSTAVVPESSGTNRWDSPTFGMLDGEFRVAAFGNIAVIAGFTDTNEIRAIRFGVL